MFKLYLGRVAAFLNSIRQDWGCLSIRHKLLVAMLMPSTYLCVTSFLQWIADDMETIQCTFR